MFRRVYSVAKKEIRQLKRDKRMLYVLFVFPLLLLVLFGYAINFDVHHIKIAVYDKDKSPYSRQFINRLTSSDYFDLVKYLNTDHDIGEALEGGDAQAIIIFPVDYSENIYSGKETKLQILIEGVNANTAGVISNYINASALTFAGKIKQEALILTGANAAAPVNVEPRFWFNPELKSTVFLIPGLISMILVITAVVSTSLSLVREKEKGSMEQINVSPLSSAELMLGKTIPYILISLFIAAVILLAGYFLFSVPVRGNFLLLFLSTLIFLFASLNLGIFVSSISNTQQIAFQISTMLSFLPSFILSGFVYPIESMPAVIQIFTNVTPTKFFIVILRDILLKGAGLESFWQQILYLLIFASIFMGLAIVINRKNKIA